MAKLEHTVFCKMCGRRIAEGKAHYVVRIQVFAADDPPEKRVFLSDGKDFKEEVARLLDEIAQTDPEELEDGVYKFFKFDLCRPCQRLYIKNPFGQR